MLGRFGIIPLLCICMILTLHVSSAIIVTLRVHVSKRACVSASVSSCLCALNFVLFVHLSNWELCTCANALSRLWSEGGTVSVSYGSHGHRLRHYPHGQHSASSTKLLPNHLGALQGTDSVNHGFLFCHSLTPALAAGFGVNKLSVDRHLEISGHPSVTLLSEGHFLALELLFQELLEGRGKSAIPSAAAILDVDLQAHAVQKIEV